MIDTRTKIVDAARAPQGRPVAVVYCDPLLPAYVSKLRARGKSMVLVLATPPDAYLEPQARAELAASLDFVESVVIAAAPNTIPAALQPGEIVTSGEEELALRSEFLAYVRDRARQP